MEQVLAMMCANTRTASALHRRIGLLQAALEEVLFSSGQKNTRGEAVRNYLKGHAAQEDAAAMCDWDDALFERFSPQSLGEEIAALRREGESLPSLTLYVPVELDEEALVSLSEWLRTQTRTHALVDLHVDPNTVGGCALVAHDRYHDLSFHTALKKKSGIVAKLLNTYA